MDLCSRSLLYQIYSRTRWNKHEGGKEKRKKGQQNVMKTSAEDSRRISSRCVNCVSAKCLNSISFHRWVISGRTSSGRGRPVRAPRSGPERMCAANFAAFSIFQLQQVQMSKKRWWNVSTAREMKERWRPFINTIHRRRRHQHLIIF